MIKKVYLHKKFKESYKKRGFKENEYIKSLISYVSNLLIYNLNDKALRVHDLKGSMKGKKSLSLTDDIRIIFIETETQYIFLDIGSHSDVYNP